ncbi:uncharacterized protein LOC142817575 [Rhipicephalus microplus]|uniref:uncharacterized protein LOC142817575 n=1 Tax=Rhipicephalus microplus TaxID=6941 RepID=UPI003F6D067E
MTFHRRKAFNQDGASMYRISTVNLGAMLLLFFTYVETTTGITFEESAAELCYVDRETMTKFVECVMVVLPEKFRLSAQRMFDMFGGMSKTDVVLLMCKSAMDAATALFDDFVTMYAALWMANM